MPTHIDKPARIEAAGNMPKIIDEYIGRLNTKQEGVSVAHMRSPAGWQEAGQTPEFEEYTIVLRGRLARWAERAAAAWQARKTAKVMLGPAYETLRRALLSRRAAGPGQ